MRKLQYNKQSANCNQLYAPGSSAREAIYHLSKPLLAIPCGANVLREIVDYYIPIELSKRSEFWRGMRETFFSTSTMFAKSTRKYGIDFHKDIVEKGNMRKTHVFRHTAAQTYDVYIGYTLTPFYVPISWTWSATHDILYNFVNPLIPNKTIRKDAKNWTEVFRAAKLFFNCPGKEELINIKLKYNQARKRITNHDGEKIKDIGTIMYSKLNGSNSNNKKANGLENIINSAKSIKGAAEIPGECGNSVLSVLAEHKLRRKTPEPIKAIKNVLDDARTAIVGAQHSNPWRRTKKLYDFIKYKL